MRRFVMIMVFLAGVQSADALENEKPAEDMRDVQAHFVRCFRTPAGLEGMRGTFHFSLKSDGGLIGEPRIAWLKLDKSRESQKHLEERLLEAFNRCVPVPLGKDMARVTPGKVLFFRFDAVTGKGKDKSRPVFNGPID